MKQVAVVLAILLLCCSCTDTQKSSAASSVISVASSTGASAEAKKFLADVKARMAKEVKPEYFKSDEWKAFVDSYWRGYNQGQQQMLHPDYVTEYTY